MFDPSTVCILPRVSSTSTWTASGGAARVGVAAPRATVPPRRHRPEVEREL